MNGLKQYVVLCDWLLPWSTSMFFFMAKYSITWIYYTTFSRFTHQLGFFFSHFLGIMNNGVVKIHVQSFFFLSFFVGKCYFPWYIPNSEIAGHVIVLCLTFWETTKLFFTVTISFCTMSRNVWGLLFLHISHQHVIFIFFNFSNTDWYEVIPYCAWFLFP